MHSKKIFLLLLLLTLFSFGCGDDDNDSNFAAELNGASEVPPVNTSASGNATFNVDAQNNRIDFDLNVSNISNVVAAHIHAGAVGVNGDVVAFLFSGPQTGTVNGQLASGTIRASDVLGISFDQLVTNMRTGQAYVNVHTVQNPNGEIRGQIELRD